ncbi:hypothetical protein [Persicirhabdus sediminis]|uniref:Uncharacterized protein n=1 Tax=Persicirhabdus sediminis TaxID=454144 RepID=A0A8J7MBR6_9BACT|nr:hypothetical protein [Persicirhabdus sediminis]MBK1790182.1 hypothetical protein [Persicirhabdus sediminis]
MKYPAFIVTACILASCPLASAQAEIPKVRKKKTLADYCLTITGPSTWTYIPKGSIIHTPKRLNNNINGSTQNKSEVTWQQFAQANPTTVKAFEVTIEQARGLQPIAQEYKDQFLLQRVIVVAVHNGSPIQMITPSNPVAENTNQ